MNSSTQVKVPSDTAFTSHRASPVGPRSQSGRLNGCLADVPLEGEQ